MGEKTFEEKLGDLLAEHADDDKEDVMTALECALYALKEQTDESDEGNET